MNTLDVLTASLVTLPDVTLGAWPALLAGVGLLAVLRYARAVAGQRARARRLRRTLEQLRIAREQRRERWGV